MGMCIKEPVNGDVITATITGTVELRGTIKQRAWVRIRTEPDIYRYIALDELTDVKIVPKPLVVGDKVLDIYGAGYTIIGIDSGHAWLKAECRVEKSIYSVKELDILKRAS